jgi:5'-nucleotidase
MKILLSNDDGYQAPGLRCLQRSLCEIAEVVVVAPDRNRSGASNSLTLDDPLRVQEAPDGYRFVNGTPTDCVHLGLTGLLDEDPDMVIAGINAGANMGDDVLYSGTVAAAMEGRFLGRPAIAVSLCGQTCQHYDTAAWAVRFLLERGRSASLPADTILSVNVPDLPWQKLAGFRVTRLGRRHRSQPVVRGRDPRGRPIYWVGPVGAEQDAGPDTDFHAVRNGYVSVTPLHIDLTRYSALHPLSEWLQVKQ